MKITIISGSTRPKAESSKVANYVANFLKDKVDVEIIDLSKTNFPFWDEGMWKDPHNWHDNWTRSSKILQASDGFVVISPEWAGMVPAALKNFFTLATNGELYHKPGLLIGVSSGMGGAYPIAELRMSSYKNTHIAYLPEHMIIRGVTNYLNEPNAKDKVDAEIRERLAYVLNVLLVYTRQFIGIRESGVLDRKKYPYGL